MISRCDFCRWVTDNVKTSCPDCGRGIELDFENTVEFFISQGYRRYRELWESEDEEYTSDSASAVSRTGSATDSFNNNFAQICGTSAIKDTAPVMTAADHASGAPLRADRSQGTVGSAASASDSTAATDFLDSFFSGLNASDELCRDAAGNARGGGNTASYGGGSASHSVPSVNAASGDFSVTIDSTAANEFRNGGGSIFTQTENPISVSIDTNVDTQGSFGDFAVNGQNRQASVSSYDAEYERQRRASRARERRYSFFDRIRRFNFRNLFRCILVFAVLGFLIYIWMMREEIMQSLSEFFASVIPGAVLLIVVVVGIRSLFRRRY